MKYITIEVNTKLPNTMRIPARKAAVIEWVNSHTVKNENGIKQAPRNVQA